MEWSPLPKWKIFGSTKLPELALPRWGLAGWAREGCLRRLRKPLQMAAKLPGVCVGKPEIARGVFCLSPVRIAVSRPGRLDSLLSIKDCWACRLGERYNCSRIDRTDFPSSLIECMDGADRGRNSGHQGFTFTLITRRSSTQHWLGLGLNSAPTVPGCQKK